MISLRAVLVSAGMEPPISILNDVLRNSAAMPTQSLRELLDFDGLGVDRTLNLLGWSGEAIAALHNTSPRLTNPHRNYLFWHKGQTHCHSDESDGNNPPSEVEEQYRQKGYTFICLTDHDKATCDPGIPGILHIRSVESGDWCRHHLNALGIHGADQYIGNALDEGSKSCECDRIQLRIDKFTMAPVHATVALNHPHASHSANWTHIDCGEGWSYDELKNSGGYTGIEICNSGTLAVDWWDQVLVDGHPSCWGFATDDCHQVYHDNKSFNRGWVVVNSVRSPQCYLDRRETILQEDILNNIREGNFIAVARSPDKREPRSSGTAGTGLKLRIGTLGDLIIVQTDPEGCCQFHGMTASGQFTRPADASNPNHAVYKLKGDEVFVRVEVEQTADGELYRAYSQPLMVRQM